MGEEEDKKSGVAEKATVTVEPEKAESWTSQLPNLEVFSGIGLDTGVFGEVWENVKETLCVGKREVIQGIEASTTVATDAVRQAREEFFGIKDQVLQSRAAKEACENWRTAKATYREYEDLAVTSVRKGILDTYNAYPEATIAGGSTFLVFAFPTTRRFVLRNTVGRFRSQEGLQKSATRRKEVLGQTVELHLQETNKLLERTKLAKDEFIKTHQKLKDARNQLDSLQSRLYKTDQSIWSLLDDAKTIKTKDALALRSQISLHQKEIRKQTKRVAAEIKSIANTAGI